jgi:hypothetical protein
MSLRATVVHDSQTARGRDHSMLVSPESPFAFGRTSHSDARPIGRVPKSFGVGVRATESTGSMT